MANTFTKVIMVDGARNAVLNCNGYADTSDFSSTDVAVPANYTPTPTTFRVDRIQYQVEAGITVRLWWDATTPVLFATLSGSGGNDFRRVGGLQNTAGATGYTGKITFTTEGWASSAIDNFTFTLEMVKIGV